MSDDANLTPYERTYGAPVSSGPAAAGSPAPQAQPPAPAPQPEQTPPQQPAPQAEAAPQAEPASQAEAAPQATQPAASQPDQPAKAEPSAPEEQPVQAAEQAAPAAQGVPAQAAPVAPQGARHKVWPWVLLGCCVTALLVIGGCTACSLTLSTLEGLYGSGSSHHSERWSPYDDSGEYPYPLEEDENGILHSSGPIASYNDILELHGTQTGTVRDGKCSAGAYRVGSNGDIAPGLYYLQGSQEAAGYYYIYTPASRGTTTTGTIYAMNDSVVYLGGYFVELQEGDVMVFEPPSSNETMSVASSKPLDVKEPYQSGCYRVGIDIPAGTYAITADPKGAEAAAEADAEAAAFVMGDLFFDEGSIVEEAYVIAGSRQTVTVEDGQYLELFAAQATAVRS